MSGFLSPVGLILQAFSDLGVVGAGYQITTYVAGTTTPFTTYTDSTLGTPNTNPIVMLANGRLPASVWVPQGTFHKMVLQDASGGSIAGGTVDNLTGINDITNLSQAIIGQTLWPQTSAEIAAGVAPTSYAYPPGDIRRYGAALDGVTDDTAAVQRWVSVGGSLTFPVSQIALISSAVTLKSNTTIQAAQGATIKIAINNLNMFSGTSITNTIIRGLTFLSTSAISSVQVGGITLLGCTYITIEECTFTGMSFTGIYASGISYCTIRGNTFTANIAGQSGSSADINVQSSPTTTSSFNVIDGNFCYGGGEFGIAVWDPYSGVLSINNIVCNNRIGAQTGYGILFYMPDAGDSYNQAIGNHIENISGSIASNVSSGAGIYVVGNGNGGTLIQGNTIRNCCLNTANATLAPAGIGVSGSLTGGAPIVISGNIITDMQQYNGILITGCAGGVSVTGNTIRMPTQSGSIGDGIRVNNSNSVSISDNTVTLLSTTTAGGGITLAALGASCISVTVTGNTLTGGHGTQLRCLQTGGNQVQNVVFSGNICTGGDNSNVPLQLDSTAAINVLVQGNILRGGTATVISQAACTNVRYVANFLSGTGTAFLTTSGTCTGSFYDRANVGTGTGAGVVNGATGFVIEQLGTAAPVAGTWAVGDTIRNSAPSAAGVYEWITTTAGAGTWKTISNT